MIPFVNLNKIHQPIMPEINATISKVINNSAFIMGEGVELFEQEFASYCGVKYGVGCSSGTSALFLALKSLGMEPGDEVITTTHTFIATAEAISNLGAKPVFVDIDEETFNIDPNKIETAITAKTKAIIVVHLYGQCADMDPILSIAKKYNLKVVEDAAQAHGATYKGRKAGSLGDAGCFSFYPGKNLGAFGDAGMVLTNNKIAADFMRALANHGRTSKYEHFMAGDNFRIDALQAAILSVKLKYLDSWTDSRIKAAQQYNKLLKPYAEIQTPKQQENCKHVYHLYVIKTKQRDALQKFLKQKNIETGIHYPIPLHLQKAYKKLGYVNGDFKTTEKIATEVLSLPLYAGIEKENIESCVLAIAKGVLK